MPSSPGASKEGQRRHGLRISRYSGIADGLYRISVRLVDVSTSIDVWAHSHEVPMGNEFEIQKRVANIVARDTGLTFARGEDGAAGVRQLNLGLF